LFLSDAKYIILCLTRELDIVPCHCQYGSCNRSNMAAETGRSYISGTNIDSVEIPTANPEFSTVTSSKKLLLNDCDDDRQCELALWLPKPEVLIALATV